MTEPLFPCTNVLRTPNPPFWTTKQGRACARGGGGRPQITAPQIMALGAICGQTGASDTKFQRQFPWTQSTDYKSQARLLAAAAHERTYTHTHTHTHTQARIFIKAARPQIKTKLSLHQPPMLFLASHLSPSRRMSIGQLHIAADLIASFRGAAWVLSTHSGSHALRPLGINA